MAEPSAMREIDLARVIDTTPISAFQWRVFFLCAAIAFMDGVDTQVIGAAAPALGVKLGFARSAFGVLFASGLVGAMLGALSCGLLADRWGRKRVLVVATAFFGVFTFVTPWVGDLNTLLLVRFLAGVGLGGAVPCFVAMVTEYAPASRRTVIVSALWAAFPLGAMCGGFINALLLERYGWQALFLLWGGLPLALALGLAAALPESARFLISKRRFTGELVEIARRIAPGCPADVQFTQTAQGAPAAPLRSLLSGGYFASTLLLWSICFLAFGAVIVVGVWTPALLTQIGLSMSLSAVVVGFNGFGSFIGTGIAGRLMQRWGIGITVGPSFALATLSFLLYGEMASSLATACLFSFLAGLFLGVCTSSGVTIAATIYPTEMRSTGIGWALGMGRFGQVVAPLLIGLMVAGQKSTAFILSAVGVVLLLGIPSVLALARLPATASTSPLRTMDAAH